MQLDFNVKEQTLTWVNKEKTPVADSVKYLTAKFTFSDEWTGIEKTATFFTADGKPYSQVLVDDGCDVPHEVIKAPLFKVSVAGGDLITTNKIIVNVVESGYVKGETPKPPTPDVYNQILEIATHAEEIAENLVEGENERVNAEEVRVSSEAERVEAENIRQANEEQRETLKGELETLKEESEQALQNFGHTAYNELMGFETDSRLLISNFNANSQEALETFESASGTALAGFAYDRNGLIEDFNRETSEALEGFKSSGADAINEFNTQAETKLDKLNGMIEDAEKGVTDFQTNADAALVEFQEASSTSLSGFDVEKNSLIDGFSQESNAALEGFATQSAEELEKVQTATDNANNATDRANEAVDTMNNTFANALKGNKSGEVVAITDISPVEHILGVKASSKNIIPFPYETKSGENRNGIIYTVNDDGSVTANGTNNTTGTGVFYLTKWDTTQGLMNDLFEDGETYKILNTSGYSMNIILHCKEKATNKDVYYYGNNSFKVDKAKYNYCHFRLQVNTGVTMDNVTFYPMIAKQTVATSYTPYVDVSTVKLDALGGNIIKFPYVTKNGDGMYGVTATVKDDGTVIINGTATGRQASFSLNAKLKLKKGVPYTLSGCSGGSSSTYNLFLQDVGYQQAYIRVTNSPITFVPEYEDYYVTIIVAVGATVNNVVIKPMLQVGEGATPYEPYKEPITYTPNADGTVEGVKSIYPSTTLVPSEHGVLVDCGYNRDLNKAFAELTQAIIAVGGMNNV